MVITVHEKAFSKDVLYLLIILHFLCINCMKDLIIAYIILRMAVLLDHLNNLSNFEDLVVVL